MEIKNSLGKIKTSNKLFSDVALLIGFILMGTIGRAMLVGWNLQPYPNFEIIMVITFLAAIFLRPTIAFLVPLFSMIFSDLLLGNPIFVGNQMNRIVLFTYSGFVMIALVNIFNRDRFKQGLGELKLKNIGMAAGLGIGFVLIYDVWTNLGWWYLIYPHTANTLAAVFTAGIPFMIYHMLSGVFTFLVIALPIISYVSMEHKIEMPIKIKKIHKLPVTIITVSLIVLSFTGTAMHVPEKSDVWLEQSDKTSVTIVITGDGWIIQDNILAYDGDTVFSILKKCSDRNGFSIDYTYYEQFDSTLINSINNDVGGTGGKYWQYYINNGDIPPMAGCDKYDVSNGDLIKWKYEIIPY